MVEEHRELFQELAPLRWLPDETVYSLASRFHRLAGHVRPAATAKLLFGHSRGGFPHALPGYLHYLAEVFAGQLGSPREIALQHTVVPQLVVAQPRSRQESTYRTMVSGATSGLKASLGLMASGFGGALPLKACQICLKEDVEQHGAGYWRTQFQLPGAWICARHGSVLEVSISMRSGESKYHWLLPAENDLTWPMQGISRFDQTHKDRLQTLTEIAIWLLSKGRDESLDVQRIVWAIKRRLFDFGYAVRTGRLRQDVACRKFQSYFSGLRTMPELARIATTPSIAYSQLLCVLEGRGSGLHPLRIAAVAAWLFPKVGDLAEQYDSARLEPVGDGQECVDHPLKPNHQKKVALLGLLPSGISISDAAKRVGVEVVTAQSWATQEGIGVGKRPSKIQGVNRESILDQLREGADKTSLAKTFGVSESSINRLLRTEVGLHANWKAARFAKYLSKTRIDWFEMISQKHLEPKVARMLRPEVYAWLYRNDRAWLLQVNQDCQRVRHTNNARANWDHRDAELSGLVQRAVEELSVDSRRIRLVSIIRLVPLLKEKLPKLDKLPMTRRVIEQALRKNKSPCPHSSL